MQKNIWSVYHFLFFLVIPFTQSSFAAPKGKLLSGSTQFVHQSYDWVHKRGIFKISEQENLESAIILKDKRIIEYAYDQKSEKLFIYDTRHKIIRVNSHAAIEEFNKVYISMRNALGIVDMKARFISKTGRIIELDKHHIKELDNPHNAGLFKIFAITGAEVGGEIEYIYTLKQNPRIFGRETFQSATSAKNISLEIISPANLIFEAKSYNGFPQMQKEPDRYPQKNVLSVFVDKMDALTPEEHSYYQSNLMRVDYKLSYNTDKFEESGTMFTWDHLAGLIHNSVYNFKNLSSVERQKYEKYLKKMFPANATSSDEKIKGIENYIKKNIRISERYSDSNKEETPLGILKNNYGTSMGVVRLFALLFTLADVEHEIVLTTDRSYTKFDKEFESWYYLEKYLFHFPNSQNFLAPHNPEYKYGMIPHNYTHNQGLFISPNYEGFDDIYTSKVKEIPATDYQSNYDLAELNIKFNEDIDFVNIHLKRSYAGYHAIDLQYRYENSSEEEKKEVLDHLFKKFGNDIEVSNALVNQQQDDPYTNYFKIEADLKTNAPIEIADNTIIFNLGSMLQKQSSLIQESNRVLNIERDYQQGSHKVVYLEIPKGYWIKNLKSLNHDIFIEENGEKTAAFTVNYDVVGNNMIRIQVEEYYKKIEYGKEHYEQYRKIMNASTNFNKMSLILEKEK